MRALRLLPLLALTGLVLLAAPAAAASTPAAASAPVPAAAQAGEAAKIVDFDYSPGELTVAAGTTVTWTNTGSRPHTATDRGGTFDTKPIAPGAKAEVTLSTPGTYFYFCRINPAKMNGVLVVEPGADEPRAVRVQAVDPGFTGDKLRFDPPELTVAAGTTLLVANVGGKPHTLTADNGAFDTGIIDPGAGGGRFAGKNASVTLNQAGTFKFHCEIHPAAMKGTVKVTGEAASAGPAAASAGPREVDVGAVDFGFEPNNASVAAGGKVQVANKGQAPHTLTFDDVQLDTGNIAPGATAELTAPDAPGSYSYRCTVHPAKMRGVLVVLGRDTEDPNAQAAAPPPAATPSGGGGGGPGAGVSAFVLAASVVAAFLGGIGISAFALRRRAAT
ncbi:MAG TPA: cupredoxin domain-containing protein [Actinomycetota bacterium]|jgi:plastocyanin|nr:cupredoxin domain-containing protein [Actinomycetota bacterium]